MVYVLCFLWKKEVHNVWLRFRWIYSCREKSGDWGGEFGGQGKEEWGKILHYVEKHWVGNWKQKWDNMWSTLWVTKFGGNLWQCG